MDLSEILVVALGATAIGFILWYFFGERQAVRVGHGSGGVQKVRITVKGGYSPDVVALEAGRPVRLEFFRDETDSCSERVVIPDFSIAKDLPPYKTTPVEFTPLEPGEHIFMCGMGMLRGKLVVEPPAASRSA